MVIKNLILIFLCVNGIYGLFCPGFMRNQTTCTCEEYYDGAIVKCNGQEGPAMVEKLKATQSEVRELALENANIVEIGPRAFKNLKLKKLTLDNNRIKNIHKDAFKGLETSLMELSIASNRLSMVPTESFEGLRALNVLSLKCNQIENLNYTAFIKIPSLIELNLACNQICDITANVFNDIKNSIQNLIIDDNCLQKIPADALENMEYLIALHLKHNEITALNKHDLKNLKNLVMLTLNGNKISSIDKNVMDNSTSLRYIYLNENNISTLEPGIMKQFTEAEVVDMSYNNLAEITAEMFSGMEHLQHLNLEANMIKDIAPGAFSTTPLLLLWLPYNCLTSVSAQIFQGTPFMKQVSFAHNNIRVVQPLSFAHLANLHTLDFSYNKIQTIQPSALMGTDFLTVRVQENPLVCNQDGFHVMNGHEAINLTTEANLICKTDYKNDINDQCPKRPAVTVPIPCCSNKIVTTTTTEAPTTEMIPSEQASETTNPVTEPQQPVPQFSPMHPAPRQRFMPEPGTSVQSSAAAAQRKLNMERFWRLSKRPEANPVAQIHSRQSAEVGTINSPRFRALNFNADGRKTSTGPVRLEHYSPQISNEQVQKQKVPMQSEIEFNEDPEPEAVQHDETKAVDDSEVEETKKA